MRCIRLLQDSRVGLLRSHKVLLRAPLCWLERILCQLLATGWGLAAARSPPQPLPLVRPCVVLHFSHLAGTDGIDTLILLDRTVDVVTPMCTQVGCHPVLSARSLGPC